ncbi:hypothetical protein FB451DRAFT_286152 [Mycena latifolia]|nr:hypothetical protein FB451DRAFT_286152 [Mycena latifolia]
MTEVLGSIASAIQLVDTALKAREYVKNFSNAPIEQKQLFTEMDELKALLGELQQRTGASPSTSTLQHMVPPLGRFKKMMENLTTKFNHPHNRWSKLSEQLTWSLWNKKEAKEYLEELDSMKSLLNTWLALEIWDAGEKHEQAILSVVTTQGLDQQKTQNTLVAIVSDQYRAQEEHRKMAERKKILDWITPLNFFQRQADIFSSWQPGTGIWLLSHAQFKTWESGSGEVLWCQGIPGAGKSVLSSMVVNHLRSQFQNSDTGVACVYLNHKETDAQSAANLLSSVWKQLIMDTSLPPEVYELYNHRRSRDMRPSLADICGLLQSAIALHSKVYIIIDALDECPEDQRNILLEILAKLQGNTTNLMMTSRPYVTPNDFFPDAPALEICATAEDICHYVDKQIKKSPRLLKHVHTRLELQNEIISTISNSVQGMFLLAKLHTESLASKHTVKAVREALQHLPTNLKQTYDEAMHRINSQNEDDRQLALQAITWVAFAKRPLTVGELREALAIEPGATTLDVNNLLDIDSVVSVCAGLIIVDKMMFAVRLVHYTTQHYFDSIQPADFPDAHTILASQCLTYLSFDDFSHLRLASGGIGGGWVERWVREHQLMVYSQHVLLHAAEAPGQLDLQPALERFLRRAKTWKHFWLWYGHFIEPWNYRWPDCPSLLWLAAASNLMKIAKHLLNQGADADTINSALNVAVFYGYIEMAELLVMFGASPHYLEPRIQHCSSFHWRTHVTEIYECLRGEDDPLVVDV